MAGQAGLNLARPRSSYSHSARPEQGGSILSRARGQWHRRSAGNMAWKEEEEEKAPALRCPPVGAGPASSVFSASTTGPSPRGCASVASGGCGRPLCVLLAPHHPPSLRGHPRRSSQYPRRSPCASRIPLAPYSELNCDFNKLILT